MARYAAPHFASAQLMMQRRNYVGDMPFDIERGSTESALHDLCLESEAARRENPWG
jgi:hypothetical protein